VKLANSRKYGDDAAHDAFTQQRAKAVQQPASTGDIGARFKSDQAMAGMRMGRKSDKGFEVFDTNGRLVGHYQ
jgi:hypothetical protein